MEITQIKFVKSNLEVELEVNKDGSYSISVGKIKLSEDPYERAFCSFRTDEVSIDDLIEALTFAKNYNFTQEK